MPKKNIEISLIISSNYRSLIYLYYLKKNRLLPKKIVFLKNIKEKIYNKKIILFLKKNISQIIVKTFLTKQINNSKVTSYLFKHKSKMFIVSLYPGAEGIIKNKLLLKKKLFIHSHPGKLPAYKGSTTIYYSILSEKKIWCDTIFLNEKIDQGSIIYSKRYPIPKKVLDIDQNYDAKIRALNLIKALKILKRKKNNFKSRKKNNDFNPTYYYIIHPILRLLTFNKIKNV